MIRQILLALVVSAASAVACASEVGDLAREAEAKAAAGQQMEAVEALRQAIQVLTAKGPLLLRRVQFITEPPQGFGVYQPRKSNVFKAGEPLIVYAEPVGMGWAKSGGFNRARIATDFEIRSPEGKILAGQHDFGRFDFASHDRNQEVMTHLTLTLSGAPAGRYVLGATYRDRQIGESRASV